MELRYTCEIGEKEWQRLLWRCYRWYFRADIVLFCGLAVYTLLEVAAFLLSPPSQRTVFSIVPPVFYAVFVLVLRYLVRSGFVRGFRKAYRRRESPQSEYLLTDESLTCVNGSTSVHAPWHVLASHYKLFDDALLLVGNGVTMTIIPAWAGHGADKSELAAALEKAGLKPAPWGRPLVRTIFWVLLSVCLLFFGCRDICKAVSLAPRTEQTQLP